MNGLALVKRLANAIPMPMAELFSFHLDHVDYGLIRASALPREIHLNPFNVVQGGFASSVLDIALGLVSVSVLTGEDTGVATANLSVHYLLPILDTTGIMEIEAALMHIGRSTVIAQASLRDASGTPYALAQSSSVILRPKRHG